MVTPVEERLSLRSLVTFNLRFRGGSVFTWGLANLVYL